MVLSRPCHPDDQFTTSILRHWCMKHDELLAEHIKSLLIKNNSLPRKRQRWDMGPVETLQARAARCPQLHQGSPVRSLPGLWATSSGPKLHSMQDHCGPFPSFPSALWLVPDLGTPPFPHSPPPSPPLPLPGESASLCLKVGP